MPSEKLDFIILDIATFHAIKNCDFNHEQFRLYFIRNCEGDEGKRNERDETTTRQTNRLRSRKLGRKFSM